MAIYRTATPDKNYTVIPNDLIRNPDFDLQTTALLIYLLSHKEDWIVTNKHIAKVWSITPNTVAKMMNRLEAAGYIKKQNDKIQWNGWDWLVTDTPHIFCDTPSQELRETPPLKNCEVRSTKDSNTIVGKRKTNRKKPVPLSEAALQQPAGCSSSSWEKWIRYRSAGRPITERVLRNCSVQFTNLKNAGLKSWDKAVDVAISEKWNSINPDYTKIKVIIKQDKAANSVFEGVV